MFQSKLGELRLEVGTVGTVMKKLHVLAKNATRLIDISLGKNYNLVLSRIIGHLVWGVAKASHGVRVPYRPTESSGCRSPFIHPPLS